MATALTSGNIYLIESDAVDNQNWLHDPENIDLDNFTEGTDYCTLAIPQNWRIQGVTGLTVTHVGGASSFMLRYNKRAYRVLNQGIETSRANANLVINFIMDDRHTAASSTTFKQYYLILKEAANAYEEFKDQDNNTREYCKGVVLNWAKVWNENDNLNRTIQINWESTWRT